jgi:phosphoglycolate phosphatase-like HAD superfamily hydrolase
MIKLVAFDWNGTLIADNNAVFESDNEVLKFLGRKKVSFTDFLKHFDVPVKNYYLALGLDEKILEEKAQGISQTFHKYYEKRATKIRSRSHAKETLNWLSGEDISAVIISNHIKEKIIEQLVRLKMDIFFDEVLGNYSIGTAYKTRNKKERLLEYLNSNNINPADILIVGDTLEEIQMAKELKALSVAITHGNCSTPRLNAAKPDYLISDLGNIINIIREINYA